MNKDEHNGELPEGDGGPRGGATLGGHAVRVHIDRVAHETETPTTGAALYALAEIGQHFELFREVEGDDEDDPIPRDGTPIRLREDEHFYSQKEYSIVVNAREAVVDKRRLSYVEVVALAFNPVPVGPDVIFTITYRKGPRSNPKGTLPEGESVFVKNGMIFVVTQTNRS
jgi:hypothetical protein